MKITQTVFVFFFLFSANLILAFSTIIGEEDNVCTIHKEVINVRINSLDDVKYTVSQEMTFYNKHSQLQNFQIGYDKDTKIKSVAINIIKDGEIIKKYTKKDLNDYSAISSFSIYEDSRFLYADLELEDYPYTVEISYEKHFKELVSIPYWNPQKFNSKVESATYQVSHPNNIPINYKTMNADFNFNEVVEGDVSTKRWDIENLQAFKKERYMPNASSVLPYLICVPEKFNNSGYKGSFENWESFSTYLWNLNKDRDELSDEQKTVVDKICAGLTTDREKVNALYKYMQENMRYVSVQLGIGGWQTFDAKYVEENKFGDCKALSNFMKAMLKHAGIKSNMIVIGSGRNSFPLQEDFVSPNMNHMILYVPEEDMWLECTSTYGPLDYIGSSTEDRNCLLVSEKNGGLIKTPALSKSSCTREQTIILDGDGNASCQLDCKETGMYQESNRYYINTEKKSELEDRFTEEFSIKGAEIVDFELNVDQDSPSLSRSFELQVRRFANKTGKRFFVPVSLVEHDFYMLSAEERIHDLLFRSGIHENDEISITIPEGFVIESMPESKYEIETKYGKYIFAINAVENQINISRALQVHKGQYPVSEYEEVKAFMKMVRKMDNAKIVLKEAA